jgi:hypothetical protein
MKMTLTFDEETASIAKKIAKIEGSSVSALVRTFFKLRADSMIPAKNKINPRLEKLLAEGKRIKEKQCDVSDSDLIARARMEKYG